MHLEIRQVINCFSVFCNCKVIVLFLCNCKVCPINKYEGLGETGGSWENGGQDRQEVREDRKLGETGGQGRQGGLEG